MRIVEWAIRLFLQFPILKEFSDMLIYVKDLATSTQKEKMQNETKRMENRKNKDRLIQQFVLSAYIVPLSAMLPILEKLLLDFGYQPFISKYEMLEKAIYSSFSTHLFVMLWFIIYFASWQILRDSSKRMLALQVMRLPNYSHDMKAFVSSL